MRRRASSESGFPAHLRRPPGPGEDERAWLEARRDACIAAGMSEHRAGVRMLIVDWRWLFRREEAARSGLPFDNTPPEM